MRQDMITAFLKVYGDSTWKHSAPLYYSSSPSSPSLPSLLSPPLPSRSSSTSRERRRRHGRSDSVRSVWRRLLPLPLLQIFPQMRAFDSTSLRSRLRTKWSDSASSNASLVPIRRSAKTQSSCSTLLCSSISFPVWQMLSIRERSSVITFSFDFHQGVQCLDEKLFGFCLRQMLCATRLGDYCGSLLL